MNKRLIGLLIIITALTAFSLNAAVVANYSLNYTGVDDALNNNATIFSATGTENRFGESSKAMFFNGTDAYMELPHNNSYNFNSEENFSLKIWVNPTSYPSNGEPAGIVHISRNTNEGFGYGIRMEENYFVGYIKKYGSEEVLVSVEAGTNLWQYIALTYNSTNKRLVLYKNGMPEDEAYSSITAYMTTNVWYSTIGRNDTNNSFFHGDIDDLMIDNTVLPQGDINTNYHWGGWDMNDPSWGLVNGNPGFPARSSHELVVFNGKIWIFGGFDGVSSMLGDMYNSEYGSSWSSVPTTGLPAWEMGNTAIYNGHIWYSAGKSGTSIFEDDIYKSPDGTNWTLVNDAPACGERANGALIVFNKRLWTLGGHDSSSKKNDIWTSKNGSNWTEVPVIGERFSPRENFGYLVKDGAVYVFGGSGLTGKSNDVWRSYDMTNWTRLIAHAPWKERSGMNTVIIDEKLFLFGGHIGSYTNDIWSSKDGVNWNLELTNETEFLFHESQMVKFNKKVFFAGGNIQSGGPSDDVWKLNTVMNTRPVAWWNADSYSNNINNTINFSAEASYDNDTSDTLNYSWDFNNDRIGDTNGTNTSYRFPHSGEFEVRLLVDDGNGGLDEFIDTIVITNLAGSGIIELYTAEGRVNNSEKANLAMKAGDTTNITFTISNTGNSDLNLLGSFPVEISGPHSSEFDVSPQPGTIIGPNSFETFSLSIEPDNGGLKQASLIISNDDQNSPNFSIDMNVLVKGCVSRYELNNSGDDLYNANNLSTVGTAGTEDRFGRAGNALYFDGASSYIEGPNSVSLRPLNKLTVSAWIKADSYTMWGGIIDNGWDNGMFYEAGYFLHTDGAGKISFWVETENGSKRVYTGQPIPTNEWHHIAGVYDGTTISIYTNGVLSASAPQSGKIDYTEIMNNSDTFNVGTYKDSNEDVRFHGAIDDVRVYNTAISSTEIEAMIDHPKIKVLNDGSVYETISDTYNFSDTSISDSDSATFTISNLAGYSNLALLGSPLLEISGPDAADFSYLSAPSASIAPDDSTTFIISFDPSTTGTKNAVLQITNSDPSSPSIKFNLTGVAKPAYAAKNMNSGVEYWSIQEALDAASPNDEIRLRGQTYSTNDSLYPVSIGVDVSVSGLNISGGWSADFSSASGTTVFDGTGLDYTLHMTGVSNVTIDNVEIVNNSPDHGIEGSAVFLSDTSGVTLNNLDIKYNSNESFNDIAAGLHVFGSTSLSLNNILLAHNSSTNSILMIKESSGITAQNCQIITNNTPMAGTAAFMVDLSTNVSFKYGTISGNSGADAQVFLKDSKDISLSEGLINNNTGSPASAIRINSTENAEIKRIALTNNNANTAVILLNGSGATSSVCISNIDIAENGSVEGIMASGTHGAIKLYANYFNTNRLKMLFTNSSTMQHATLFEANLLNVDNSMGSGYSGFGNRAYPATKTTLAYFPFNTNADDVGPNAYMASDFTSSPTNDRFGNADSAMQFNGSQYIDYGNNQLCYPYLSDFSVSLWFKTTESGIDTNYLFSIGDDGDSSYVSIGSDGSQIIADIQITNTHFRLNGSGPITINDGLWHHLTLSVDRTNDAVLYIDKQLIDSTFVGTEEAAYSDLLTTSKFMIGAQSMGAMIRASIDDVKIVNYPLETAEVNALFSTNGWTGNIPEVTLSHTSLTTNQSFTINLSANMDFGYWATNGGVYNQFSSATGTNITINETTTLSYYGDDGSGNISLTNSETYTIDSQAPTALLSHSTLTTNSAFTLSLNVTKDFGYWATNGGAYNQFSSATGTNITINETTTLSYYGDDGSGNVSPTNSATYTIVPDIPVLSLSHSSLTTNSPFTLIVSVDKDFGFWSTNGSTYYVLDSVSTANVSINADSTIYYYGSNGGGVSATNSETYTFDTTAPNVSIASGPSTDITTNSSFDITIGLDEDFGYVSLNGTPYERFNAPTNINVTNTTTLDFYGMDVYGNQSATQSLTYTFDTSAPLLSASHPSMATNQVFSASFSVSEGEGYLSVDGGVYSGFSGTTNLTILDDTSISVYTDDGLNQSPVSNFIYTFDSNAPFIIASLPSLTTNTAIDVVLTVDEDFGYWSTNDGVSYTQVSNGTTTIHIAESVELKYYAMDSAGNRSADFSETYTIVYERGDFIDETPAQNIRPYNSVSRDGKVHLAYNLEESEEITITVYDRSGRKVAVLFDETAYPGASEVDWDGRTENGVQVDNGVYYIEIRGEDWTRFTKILLMK